MTGAYLAQVLNKFDTAGCPEARTIVAKLLAVNDQDRLLIRTRLEAACGTEPERLRGLWTAWCMTTGAFPGTTDYENALDSILDDCIEPVPSKTYMGKYVREAYGLKN